jgi:signal transduction histidine kinase
MPAPQILMSLLGVGFTIAYVLFFYNSGAASEIGKPSLDAYIEVLLLGLPTVVLLMGAMWIHQTETDSEFHISLVVWTISMAVMFSVAIGAALSVIEPTLTMEEQLLLLLLSTGFGASAGVVVGIRSIKARHQQRQHDRALEREPRTEAKRSQLEYLNQYLRHEVLNEANKISGYASLLREQASIDDDMANYLETVCQSSKEIEVFIQSIRSILDDESFEPEFETLDLDEELAAEVAHAEHAYPNADISVVDMNISVVAGDMLNRVFRNLFENAIEHNTGEVTITVSATVNDGKVTITVADNGDGIPPADRETLFEPPTTGDHGYGMFLTRNLVKMYNGTLRLVDTGEDGTTFTIELMAADNEPVERVTDASAATNVKSGTGSGSSASGISVEKN